MIIIGLTGPMAGGKGVVADYLKSKGFDHFSLSDRIRDELKKLGLPESRENLQEIADKMRVKYGPAVLAMKTWESATKQKVKFAVLETIRGQAEVDFLKSKPNFYLVGITAPRKIRFQLISQRNREGDSITWTEFVKRNKLDFKSGEGLNGRNIRYCLKNADVVFQNKRTIKDLEEKVERWLKKKKII